VEHCLGFPGSRDCESPPISLEGISVGVGAPTYPLVAPDCSLTAFSILVTRTARPHLCPGTGTKIKSLMYVYIKVSILPLSLLRGLNEGLTKFFFLPDPPVGGIFAAAVGTVGQ
jgi:hypothetical protein